MVDVLGDEVHFGQDAIAQTIDQLQVRTQQMFQAEEEMRAEERKSVKIQVWRLGRWRRKRHYRHVN